MSTNISTLAIERIERAEAADTNLDAAYEAFYNLTAKLEKQDRELFSDLDAAWADCVEGIRRVAWLDGWECGRNPNLLLQRGGHNGR